MFLLFVFLAALLPFGVLIRVSLIGNAAFTPLDVIVGIIGLGVLATSIKKKSLPEPYGISKALLLFVAFGLVSLLVNASKFSLEQVTISALYALRFLWYSLLLFSAINLSNKNKSKLQSIFFVSGAVTVLFGFVQYFFYQNLRNLYYLGWDDHLYRMFGTFLDPNFAGAFFVLFLLYSGFLLSKQKNLKGKASIGIIAILFLTFIAIILTHSRSAALMLLIAIPIAGYKLVSAKVLVTAVLLFVLAFGIFSNTHVENLNPFRIASTEARILSAIDGYAVFSKNILIGTGFNAYRYAQVKYGLKSESGAAISHADGSTDNSYIFVLATTGVIGFLLFINYYKLLITMLVKSKMKNKSFIIALVVGFLVDSFFINSLFYSLLLAWVMVVVGFCGVKEYT